jgi:hypothetical protein
MQMKMDQLTTALVVAEKAQCRRMITITHGWKELEIPLAQYHQDAMLVGSCQEQVEISSAGQHVMQAPAALPITIRNVLPMKFVQNRRQPRWHWTFEA